MRHTGIKKHVLQSLEIIAIKFLGYRPSAFDIQCVIEEEDKISFGWFDLSCVSNIGRGDDVSLVVYSLYWRMKLCKVHRLYAIGRARLTRQNSV